MEKMYTHAMGGEHWDVLETAKSQKKIIQNRKKLDQTRKPQAKPPKSMNFHIPVNKTLKNLLTAMNAKTENRSFLSTKTEKLIPMPPSCRVQRVLTKDTNIESEGDLVCPVEEN